MKVTTELSASATADLIKESEARSELGIKPIGAMPAKFMFADTIINDTDYFSVVGTQTIKINNAIGKFIEFNFYPYRPEDDVRGLIKETLESINDWLHSFEQNRMTIDMSIVKCFDKILQNLGYAGKAVMVEGVGRNADGETFAFSHNYADALITPDGYTY